MSTLAIIPARGGSKGLPGKNIRLIAGKPLIAWSIQQGLAAHSIDAVVVSTDSEEIAAVAREAGAEVPFMRPSELAEDATATEPVMLHALDVLAEQGRHFDAIVLLQPTSPLRRLGMIDGVVKAITDRKADSVLTVVESHAFFWSNPDEPMAHYNYRNRPRRQDIAPADRRLRETGSVYATGVSQFRASGNRLSGKIALHLTSEEESWEIDSAADFAAVEALLLNELPS